MRPNWIIARVSSRIRGLLLVLFLLLSAPVFCDSGFRVLALGPENSFFTQVMARLEHEFQIYYAIADASTAYESFEADIERIRPHVVVLLDNVILNHYREYQRRHPDRVPFPPIIAMMGVHIDASIKDLNIMGINYQVPAVSSLVKLRDMIDIPIKKVGVLYPEGLESSFQQQHDWCSREKINLIGHKLSVKSKDSIRKGLKKLIKQDKVDALWIFNDHLMLSPDMIVFWKKRLRKFNKPIVVGLENLVRSGVGNFAVVPDSQELSVQLEEIIFELEENGWRAEPGKAYDPISHITILNVSVARAHWKLNEEKLVEVDIRLDESNH